MTSRTENQEDEMEKQPTVPEIGMGVTVSNGNDCWPGTIVSMTASKKTIVIQHDTYEMKDNGGHGIYGQQEYTYERDPDGAKETFSLRPDGRYRRKGSKYTSLSLGNRRRYYNPSF